MYIRYISKILMFLTCFSLVNSESVHSPSFPWDLSMDYLEMQHMKLKYGLTGIPPITNRSAPYPVYDNCMAYLEEFGKYASKFIKCTVEKARPFRFCEECVIHYKLTMELYSNILEDDKDKDDCKSLLLNADRIQVLNEIYNNIEQIWKEANCKGCFRSVAVDVNGTVVYKYSKDTMEFMDKYKVVSACLRHNPAHGDGNNSVCEVCRGNYTQLNSFFKKVRAAKKDSVCMDLVDMMNYTRLMWGQQLHCSRHSPDDAVVVIIAVALLALPVVFYVGARYFVVRTKRKLMLQKRMSQVAAQTLFIRGAASSTSKDDEETQLLSTSFS